MHVMGNANTRVSTLFHFLKRSSLISVNAEGLKRLAPDVRRLADVEGLTAHRHSVEIRVTPQPGS